jgi:hypothetical protein
VRLINERFLLEATFGLGRTRLGSSLFCIGGLIW